MRALIATAGILALTGCGGEAPAPTAGEQASAAAATAPAARDSCKDIAALAEAMNETEPFTSLRTGNVMLGDTKLDDSFTTDVAPAGATCKMGKMRGFSDDAGLMYVVNCELFSSGMLDREENEVKAKAAFDAAKAELDKCLPAGWTAREGNNNGIETNVSLIYETAADIERQKTASSYVYPINLSKEWADGSFRGQMPGWKVTLNFQKETPKSAEADPAQ